nr:MAG TPA: hypothetical protein [Bacteriophage sp.]
MEGDHIRPHRKTWPSGGAPRQCGQRLRGRPARLNSPFPLLRPSIRVLSLGGALLYPFCD